MADNTEKKASNDELLKAVSDVLDEALAIYEDAVGAPKLEKGAERPHVSGKMDEGIDAAMQMQNALNVAAKPLSQPGIGDGSTTGIMAKDEKEGKDKKDKDDMEKTNEELVTMYKSLVSKMEARGLIRKAEPAAAPIQKSETAPAAPAPAFDDSNLRKSIDERFDAVTTAIKSVAETVKKIAAVPQGRKGLSGYQPLKKNEGPTPLRKGEVIGKLLELRKNGDARVSTTFITRVEQGRLMKGDEDTLKALGILSE